MRKKFLGAAAVLEVGKAERHTIEVEVSGWTGRTKIFVDRREILNKVKRYSAGDGTETFTVGTKEQHDILLQIGTAVLPVVALFVDGNLEKTTGKLSNRGPMVFDARDYPTWLRLLRAGLALGGVIVLLGGVEGELVWAGQGITFDALMGRLLVVLVAGLALVILSRLAGIVYLRPREKKLGKQG